MKTIVLIGCFLVIVSSCGNPDRSSDSNLENAEISAFEIENGIGPFTEIIRLEDYDAELAQKGRQLFNSKCLSCHNKDNRLLGPAYGTWLQDRSVEYIMNFTMNPIENVQKHPTGSALKIEYMIEMPDQDISRDEARSIIEYLRSYEQ